MTGERSRKTGLQEVEVVVFDILGTLVHEPQGLRTAIGEAIGSEGPLAEHLLDVWQRYISSQQQLMADDSRDFADSDVLDTEAAHLVVERAGLRDDAVIARLATASHRLPAWPDSAAGLRRIAADRPVIGLSNASMATLGPLSANACLHWHRLVSAADVGVYKPAPAVYEAAITASGQAPERVLMVAAHAWDLRAAQRVGMRTAYVARPVADPPRAADTFDGTFGGLDELAAALTPGAAG